MFSENTLTLDRVTPSKAKTVQNVHEHFYLATSANHKSDYTASFHAKKTEPFTASVTCELITKIKLSNKFTKLRVQFFKLTITNIFYKCITTKILINKQK